jgi:hypothetical protein
LLNTLDTAVMASNDSGHSVTVSHGISPEVFERRYGAAGD